MSGCALPERGPPVPSGHTAQATVLGVPNERFFPLLGVDPLEAEFIAAIERQRQARGLKSLADMPQLQLLAVSGGGENGAFGAGLLCGWSAQGTRPTFDLVTGISTGALTAPFAFLGSDYDSQLRTVYTETPSHAILRRRSLTAALFDDAMADNEPLFRTISRFVDDRMLAAIAAAYDRGRLLLIASTNIDAQVPVIWNVGAIAKSGHPKAADTIRRILLASAAIPGAFPPSMIEVTVDGKPYQEMHVDGGASAQVFAYPPALNIAELSKQAGIVRERHLYVIRNARLDPDWADTQRQTLPIAGRAISSMIQNQGVGDLYRIYATAQRDGVDFNLAYIPPSFDVPLNEPFDQHYMNELFNLGYELGKAGYDWKKTPPGLDWLVTPEPAPQS